MQTRWVVASLISLLLGASALVAGSSACQPSGGTPAVRVELPSGETVRAKGIDVTGEGLVTATPDLATLTLQVQVRDARAGNAWNRAAQEMTGVMKALTDAGLASQDIKTESLSLQLVTTTRDRTTIQEYQALNTITAKVRRLDDVGRLVDGAVSAGGEAARVVGLSFSIEDPKKYRDEARTLAMQDARARAQLLAGAADVELGKPENIVESGFQAAPFAARSDFAAAETPVSPGTTQVRVVVSVRYAILP